MNIVHFLEQNFCTAGIMILCTIAALVISISHYRRHPNLRIFTWYIALSLTQSITAFLFFSPSPGSRFVPRLIFVVVGTAFLLFEFIACNLFILHYITSRPGRRVVIANGLLFFGLLIFLMAANFHNILSSSYFLLDSAFLVPPCLIYFYELFQTVNPQPLKDQPSFWVITGILFLNACSIPLQLTLNVLGRYAEAAFSLNYILYSILFILLIRAYLCRPENRHLYE